MLKSVEYSVPKLKKPVYNPDISAFLDISNPVIINPTILI
jgi:hypothetical protein